jgi:hypothetical protein
MAPTLCKNTCFTANLFDSNFYQYYLLDFPNKNYYTTTLIFKFHVAKIGVLSTLKIYYEYKSKYSKYYNLFIIMIIR